MPDAIRDRSVPRLRVNAGDRSIDRRGRSRNAPALLSYGFRPFFLLGAGYAALSVPLWLLTFAGQLEPKSVFTGTAWHAHEMLFGYLAAIMAGFILTAVPNWTGRLPLSGTPLAILVGLWIAGRVAVSAGEEPIPVMIVDLLFPLALAGAVWREIIVGRNIRNLPIAMLISLFGLANLLDHLGGPFPILQGTGVRVALGVAAVMIALVGGRVTPSFTRNCMGRLKLAPLPAPMDRIDRIALVVTGSAAVGWIAAPSSVFMGAGLAAAGFLLLVRLARWRGYRALNEPIVLVLHLGYLWLAAALVLLGCGSSGLEGTPEQVSEPIARAYRSRRTNLFKGEYIPLFKKKCLSILKGWLLMILCIGQIPQILVCWLQPNPPIGQSDPLSIAGSLQRLEKSFSRNLLRQAGS